VIFAFCAALSVAIEFTQLFFPPRTVSLNDIMAEILGSAIGIVLWWGSGRRLRNLLDLVLLQGRNAAYAGLILYAIAYLGFSLFPYDFLISGEEIRAKFASRYIDWVAAPEVCGGSLRCSVKLVAEAAAVAPLGLLFCFVSGRRGLRLLMVTAAIGFCLGVTIEGLQFFLVSGVTLGASVFTRVVGMVAGAVVGEMSAQSTFWPMLYLLGPPMPIAILLYTALLSAVTWLGKGPVLSLDQGLNRLPEIYFMPFYYHYYTSESAAMTSLLGIVAMFFPIGVLYWIWRITRIREFAGRGAIQVGFLGASIGAILEIGKLFLKAARPDPTNVIIASAAAVAGFVVLSICTKASLNSTLAADDAPVDEPI
ncbi:MAG TPA: VanZ family protein, partial [Acidobacteriota bacterium]|nr:VanZ family protein [Acidobacteriota bacterium]